MAFVVNFIRFSVVEKIENQLRFDKVTESLMVGTFFETQYRQSVKYIDNHKEFPASS